MIALVYVLILIANGCRGRHLVHTAVVFSYFFLRGRGDPRVIHPFSGNSQQILLCSLPAPLKTTKGLRGPTALL